MADHEHCWHLTGMSAYTANPIGLARGGEDVKCCRCGAMAVRLWHNEERPIPGHGPHVTQFVRVVDSVEVRRA